MFQEKDPQLEKIIDQLSTMMDLCYVFESQLRSTESVIPLIIVLHQGSTTTVNQEMVSKMNAIFREARMYTFKVFPLDYAISLLKQHNLFFMQHCQIENLIYHVRDANLEQFQVEINEVTFDLVREQIDHQLSSCVHHLDAACEHKDEGNFAKALFSLYAYHKSLLDIAAEFHLGHQFEEHLISELQNLFAPFDINLSCVYDIHIEQDRQLLEYLDQAAEKNFMTPTFLNEQEIEAITSKANITLKATLQLFRSQLKATKYDFEKLGKLKRLPHLTPDQGFQKIRKDLQNLVNRKILELRPGHDKIYYKANLKVDGTADILYHISGLLKVCIMALGNENTDIFPEPKLNIQTTLEHILELLPFEEVECLERIIDELEITTDHYLLEPPKYLYA